METKNFNFEIKASDDSEMIFEGYGSIFGNMDSYRDIVEKGCFSRTINNNKSRMKFLWQHDSWNPIGRPLEIEEDSKGLYTKIKLSDIKQGRECYTLIKDEVIKEMSIGYNTVKYEYDKDKNIRYLKEVKLFEISAVTWGANDQAKINSVKFDDLLNEIKSGNLLKNASQDKILEAIKALTALIECEDSLKDTPKLDNPPEIIDTNSDFFDLVLQQLQQ